MDALVIAARYLRTRRIAIVACACVAVSVCAMVVITGVMDGFRERIEVRIRGTEPDLTIRAKTPPSRHFDFVSQELSGEMESAGGPLAALSPRLASVSLMITRVAAWGQESSSVKQKGLQLLGIDWDKERHVIPLDRILDEISPEEPYYRVSSMETDPLSERAVPGILVGRTLALKMGLKKIQGFGSTNQASLLSGRLFRDADGSTRFDASNMTFRVVGCFDSQRDDFDLSHAFISRSAYRRLRYGGASDRPDATSIHARLVDPEALDDVVAKLSRDHPSLVIETWQDRNRDLLNALRVEKRVLGTILAFIVLVALILILALLYLMVLEKTRDVGVLRSMGLSRGKVMWIFQLYGSALGILGTCVGVVGGMLILRNLNAVVDWLYDKFEIQVFSRDVAYQFREIPAVVDSVQITTIAAGTILLSFVGAALPALKAARLDPVYCLRYE